MKRIVIYPYKMGSKSAKDLTQGLREKGHNVLRVYPDRNYTPKENDLIVNWGSSVAPQWHHPMYNEPGAVRLAANKLLSLVRFNEVGVPTLLFTTNKETAKELTLNGKKMFCRTKLTGCSGQGIIVATTPDEVVDAGLYTYEFKKTHEYRVHVFNGEVLDLQEKKRREGAGNRNTVDVWNYETNFIFARQDITVPNHVQKAAINAVTALGLEFGAVDIGYNLDREECAVFEVNTAPGLTGTTLNKYIIKLGDISNGL